MLKLNRQQLIDKYQEFFKEHDHAWIPSAPLIPEGDSSTLFISAGMHPLVPYLLGEEHPLGKRLADVQECLRTGDIDEVGDKYHHTWFEMLGNWSLGDYFKQESVAMSWEFLTEVLEMPAEKLAVTIFKGDDNAPFDQQAKDAWQAVGLPEDKIFPLGKKENWWEAGEVGPGGPDTEIFFDTGKKECSNDCQPGCDCGKWVEIWNNVFIEYNRKEDGTYEELEQKNIDTGMGLARMVAVLNGHNDDYQIEIIKPIIAKVEELSGQEYGQNQETDQQIRIIADHLRGAVFILGEEIMPSNTKHGYILRRLIRRAVRFGRLLGMDQNFVREVIQVVIELYQQDYTKLFDNQDFILDQAEKEEKKFNRVLDNGLDRLKQELKKVEDKLPGEVVFDLYQSYGFPPEITKEEVKRLKPKVEVDLDEFQQLMQEHKRKSRQASKGMFRGGLAEQNEETTKLHTATHLLHQALREILGDHVKQAGSAITPEKLRFDFTHPQALTDDQLSQIEDLVNQKIDQNLKVNKQTMPLERAETEAQLIPNKNYPDQVKVYSIGDFSKEVCGGPHVKTTGELGEFKITKEKSSGAGKRRIYAKLKI
jgi:alanyl-tRNA synthetase